MSISRLGIHLKDIIPVFTAYWIRKHRTMRISHIVLSLCAIHYFRIRGLNCETREYKFGNSISKRFNAIHQIWLDAKIVTCITCYFTLTRSNFDLIGRVRSSWAISCEIPFTINHFSLNLQLKIKISGLIYLQLKMLDLHRHPVI